jgi:hypothetical protein
MESEHICLKLVLHPAVRVLARTGSANLSRRGRSGFVMFGRVPF